MYPSIYGSEPPISTRIISLCRVLTSLVPPVHNQGVSLAPLQGHALWKIFLPTTGSSFVFFITDFLPVTALFSGRFPITFWFSFQPSWLVSTFKHFSTLNCSNQPRYTEFMGLCIMLSVLLLVARYLSASSAHHNLHPW